LLLPALIGDLHRLVKLGIYSIPHLHNSVLTDPFRLLLRIQSADLNVTDRIVQAYLFDGTVPVGLLKFMLNPSCTKLDRYHVKTVLPDEPLPPAADCVGGTSWLGIEPVFRHGFQILFIVLITCLPFHQTLAQTHETGSSSRQNREHAAKLIPFSQLNQPTREKISEVVDSASLYRRLPVNSIAADPDYFRFLVRYPEVVVNIWQIMGVTQMSTSRTGPFTIDSDDGVGTTSTLDLVFGNENLHVFFGTGVYEGPVFKRKINGRCVLILRTDYRQDQQGQNHVINQMDVFLKLDNVGASIMAKTIQPIVGSTADQNFLDSLKFIQRLNETTVDNGPGVQHMAYRLNIDEEVREKFIEAAGLVYERASHNRMNLEQQRVTVPSMVGHSSYQTELRPDRNQLVGSPPPSDATGFNQLPAANPSLNRAKSIPADQLIPVYRPTPGFAPPTYGTIR
jgi:hypothetical protein